MSDDRINYSDIQMISVAVLGKLFNPKPRFEWKIKLTFGWK